MKNKLKHAIWAKKKIFSFCLTILLPVSLWALPGTSVIYVAPNGTGDGSSWENAMGSIADALNKAYFDYEQTVRPDVWVKGGTYLVNGPKDRMMMYDTTSVYGSFAGTETSIDQRPKVENGKPWEFVSQTIIDGQGLYPLYCSMVQTELITDFPMIVDGFAFVNGAPLQDSITVSDWKVPVMARWHTIFRNCQVLNSKSVGSGNIGGWPGFDVIDCLIAGNQQTEGVNGGGGICVVGYAGAESIQCHISGCDIHSNYSGVRGAGINIQGPHLTFVENCRIYNNLVGNSPTGGRLSGGSIHNQGTENSIIINNLIYNNTGGCSVTPRVYANNTVVHNAGQIYVSTATENVLFANNIVWGNATDATGSEPACVSSAAGEVKGYNNACYYNMPQSKLWHLKDNIQLSSNFNNGVVSDPTVGCGTGPMFKQYTSFIGSIPLELPKEEQDILMQDLQQDGHFRLLAASPCVNTGVLPIDTVVTITQKIVGGRPRPDTTWAYNYYVNDDFMKVSRPQGIAYDMGAYELQYCNLSFNFDNTKIMILSDGGEELTNESKIELLEGAQVILYIINISGVQGELEVMLGQTDLSDQVSAEGQLLLEITQSQVLSVTLKDQSAIEQIRSDKVNVQKVCENGQVYVIRNNQRYSILGVTL